MGELFDGIVTGASPKGTFVRLLKFPAEGRVVRGTQGIDVGDKVQVRLLSVDVDQGFINFERKQGCAMVGQAERGRLGYSRSPTLRIKYVSV